MILDSGTTFCQELAEYRTAPVIAGQAQQPLLEGSRDLLTGVINEISMNVIYLQLQVN